MVLRNEGNLQTFCFVLFFLLILVPLLCDILPEKRKLDRLISTTCSTLKSCPYLGNYDLWHIQCEHSCPDGERYICLKNEDGEPITEFCAPASLKCEPGTKGVFTIDNNDHTKVVMTVTPCPQDKYQQHSSNCINACKGNRGDFTGLPDRFVIYSYGSSVEPPEVYCNYTAGYYSSDHKFLFSYNDNFMYDYGQYCRHVNDSNPCSKGMMPLPNSSCVEPCIVGFVRDDHNNFICKPLSINPVSVDGKYLTTQPTTVFQSTTEGNKNQSWTSRYIFVIIGVVVVVVVIGLMIFILCCVWKRKQKNKNRNIKDAEEQVPLQDTEVNSEKRHLKQRNGKAGELKKTYNDTLTPTILNAVNSQAESVGCLICEEGIAGTVFKVGTNHAMTACHVVHFIIRIDKNGPNENGNFDWSQLKSDSVYVNFNELITDKPRKVSKLTCVYFNKHLDVAVLKFEDVLSIPRKMVLDKSIYRNPQKVTVIGFGNPDNNLKKHVDPSCEVIPPGSMKIRSAHAWLQGEGRKYRNDGNADNFDYGYQGYGDQHKIIFSCYLEHGASGAPIITQDRAQNVQVVGILTNGMPDFYFELSKSDQESFPFEYRFEYGTLMRYIYEDMLVKNKNLAEDIFGASGEAQHQVEGPIHIVPG